MAAFGGLRLAFGEFLFVEFGAVKLLLLIHCCIWCHTFLHLVPTNCYVWCRQIVTFGAVKLLHLTPPNCCIWCPLKCCIWCIVYIVAVGALKVLNSKHLAKDQEQNS